MKRSTLILQIILLLLVTSCIGSNSDEKKAKEVIRWSPKPAQKELNDFIGYYKNDRKKRRIAQYFVANMTNKYSESGQMGRFYQEYIDSIESNHSISSKKNHKYSIAESADGKISRREVRRDLDCIQADSLIPQTDFALNVWSQSDWSKAYSDAIFMAYVAPYRIANEPLEYYWRENAYGKYKQYLSKDTHADLKQIAAIVYDNLDFSHNNLFWGEPLQSYTDNIRYKRGKCNDHAVFTAMVMRALGIPTSVEFIPYWGDNNNGHLFNSLILPDKSCVGYNNRDDLENGITLTGKVPKIYRKEFETQQETFIWKCKDTEYIPKLFEEHDLLDVTAQYNIPVNDVTISSFAKHQAELAYLCVFSPGRWKSIAWAQMQNKKAEFKNMGTGYCNNNTEEKGENIGDGIVYLPVCYDNEEVQPINHPFILSQAKAVRYLIPEMENRTKVVLTRKFPKKKRVIEWAKKMVDAQFEIANDRSFTIPEMVHCITTIPGGHKQDIKLESQKPSKYIRLYKRRGGISLAEIKYFDKNNREIKGKCIADEYLTDDAELQKISDADVLSYFDVSLDDTWVGLEFAKPSLIDKITYCPRTDDNDICPGDVYELYYWNKKWISLGCQQARDYSLIYESVPRNALLWLRNLTKGTEERPFTYENDQQIWW